MDNNILYFDENEENAKQVEILKIKLEEKDNEIKHCGNIFESLQNCKTLIDIDFLLEFLDDNNLLNDKLKNKIDYFTKFFETKSDLENYINPMTYNSF